MARVGTAYVDVRGDLSSLNRTLAGFFGGSKFAGLGKRAGAGIGVGLAAGLAGKALFDLGEKFDEQFDKIRVGSGKTGKVLDGLEDDFRSVVKSVPTDFGSAGDAISELSRRTKLTGEPLRRLTKTILQLSRITGTDAGDNVRAISRLFGDWSVTTGDQENKLNKLFRVTQKTGIELGDLSRLMVKFGSPLRTLGFDFEQTAAMFGRFEREGVNLQTTLPGFKQALKNFAKPTQELAVKFKKFGVDAEEPRKALLRIFELIKSLPEREGTQLAFQVFGSRAATDMARAVKEGRFELDDLLKSMSDGSDTINKAEEDTRDFAEEWQMLKNRVFVGLEPLATKVFDTIGDGLEKFAKLSPALQAITVGVPAALLALGPLAAMFSAMGRNATTIGGAFGLAGRAGAGGAGAGTGSALAAGAAGAALGRGKVTRQPGIQRGGQLIFGPGFRSGAPVSQLGQVKGLARVNAGLSAMLASLRAAPGLWAGLTAAVVIAGVKIKNSKTFEGFTGGLVEEKTSKIQAQGITAMRSGLDQLAAASQRAQVALPSIAAAEKNLSALRKQGKTDTHAYAEAIRTLDAAQGERISALRQRTDAEKQVLHGVREQLRASAGKLALDKKLGASDDVLKADAIALAHAYSRQQAALLNVSRAMRGLTPITGTTGAKMGALLKTLKGVAGLPQFKKFLVTADISSANAAVRVVERLQKLGRVKTALKIIAESKSPEEALKRLRGLANELTRKRHDIRVKLKDEATVALHKLGIQLGEYGRKNPIEFLAKIKQATPFADDVFPPPNKKKPRARGGVVGLNELSLVGEEGPELAKYAGKTGLVGLAGPEIRSFPENTRIYSHPETKRKLAPVIQKVSRVLDGKTLPGVEGVKQSQGQVLSKPLGGRTLSRVAERMGIPGFKDGGRVKGASSEFSSIATRAWDYLNGRLGVRNARMPRIFVTSRDSTDGAEAVTLRGKHDAGWIRFAKGAARETVKGDDYGLWALVHEFAHTQQDKGVFASKRLAEGGATDFGFRHTKRVAQHLGMKYSQQNASRQLPVDYREDLAWVLSNRDQEWLKRGQFKAFDAKGRRKGGPNDHKNLGRAASSLQPAARYLANTMRQKFGLNISPQGGVRPDDTGSFHSVGKAVDLVGSKMREGAEWVKTSGLYKTLLEGIHNPNLSTDSGKMVSSGFWGGQTWAGHKDHVHLAADSIRQNVKQNLDQKGGAKKRSTRITGGSLSLGQMVTLSKKAGFPDPALAAAIGYAESRGKVGAVGDGGDSLGLFQINTPAHPKYDKDRLANDAFYNARAALAISKKGKNWQPWTQFRTGAYKQFLGGKGKPLPKGTSKGTPSGSSYADYLEMKLTDAEGTKSDPKDDIKWINRALRYWRGVNRRNRKVGNWARANTAKGNINDLLGKKKTARGGDEEPTYENLGSLAPAIGKGASAFKTAPLEAQLEQINLEKARASLTLPADTDDSPQGLKASLQDDIAASTKQVTIWDGLNKLVSGFFSPTGPVSSEFKPTPEQSKQLAKTKNQPQRIALLNKFQADWKARGQREGTWTEGTIGQKIEAATNLGSAKDDLRNLLAEINKAPETIDTPANDAKEQIRAFMAAIGDLTKTFGSNFKPLQSFADGGIIQGPKGRKVVIEGHGGEAVINEDGNLTVTIDPRQLERMIAQQQPVVKNIDARMTFANVPKDPHIWSRNVKHELEAA